MRVISLYLVPTYTQAISLYLVTSMHAIFLYLASSDMHALSPNLLGRPQGSVQGDRRRAGACVLRLTSYLFTSHLFTSYLFASYQLA